MTPAALLAQARWKPKKRAKSTKAKAARELAARRKTFGAGTGRPRTVARCPCGAMNVNRAAKRNHKCEKG